MDSVNFNCRASRTPLPTLNWSTIVQNNGTYHHNFNERISIVNENLQNNEIVSTLNIQSVQLEDESRYICTNLVGSQIVMLTVYDLIVGKFFLVTIYCNKKSVCNEQCTCIYIHTYV